MDGHMAEKRLSNTSAFCAGLILIVVGAAGGSFLGRMRAPAVQVEAAPALPAPDITLPKWVPVFPGATVTERAGSEHSSASTGEFLIQTDAKWERVVGFYNRELQVGGYRVGLNKDRKGAGALVAQNGKGRTIRVASAGDQLILSYSEKR